MGLPPKSSSIFMGFSPINHPFIGGYPHGHGNHHHLSIAIHALLGRAAHGVDRLLQTQRFVHRALPLRQLRQQLRGEAGAGGARASKEAAGLGAWLRLGEAAKRVG